MGFVRANPVHPKPAPSTAPAAGAPATIPFMLRMTEADLAVIDRLRVPKGYSRAEYVRACVRRAAEADDIPRKRTNPLSDARGRISIFDPAAA